LSGASSIPTYIKASTTVVTIALSNVEVNVCSVSVVVVPRIVLDQNPVPLSRVGLCLGKHSGSLGVAAPEPRLTIRKRMRAKLRSIKPELRKRMHDPLSQGQWLKSIVRGYFNYYAVPGNTASLGVFRHKLLVHWWHSVRRRSQKHRISWTRMLALAMRWLPEPKVLHPFPDARFAVDHPR
jgi:hypothetical protein